MLKNKFFKILSIGAAILLLLLFFTIYVEKSSNLPKYKQKFSNLSLSIFLKLPDFVKSSFFIISGKRSFSNLFNDYNVKFLPNTQLIDLEFKRIKTDFKNRDGLRFYIEVFQNKLIITNKFGEFFETNLNEIINEKKINFEKVNIINFPNKTGIILDTLIIDDTIYFSKISNYNGCEKLEIYEARIKEILDFKIFKSFEECKSISIGAGRLSQFTFYEQEGILITTNDSDNDLPGSKAQDDSSVFGKIIFVDLNSRDHKVISKGHRNAQGIAVIDDIILSTEHGPKGGDEINRIIFGKNYGWPVASYGNPYENKKLKYLDSHKKNEFEEPLYVFVPSIGISELIILPNQFNSKWKDNILVTSLNGRSIYRIKFTDQSFEKILYHEKIYIGERIRDIKYIENLNVILLALERTGDVGILVNKN